jgi:CIC family chloride channel protein
MSTAWRRFFSPDFAKRLIAFPSQFDRREQHLVVASIVIGAVVWAAVFALKWLVHELFAHVLEWVEPTPMQLAIFIPLVIGSLITILLATWRASSVYFRDESGHVHALNDVVGDGLERTIALYYSSEPAFERALLGVEGVRARWELPTFGLALRKFGATLATLGLGGSGGLEASVTLIGESLAVGLFKPRPRLLPHRLWALRFWRWWRTFDPDELQTVQLSGVAAAVTTLLGAPLAGAFFAVEVMYRRRPVIEKLIYALVASLTAFLLNQALASHASALFTAENLAPPPLEWRYYLLLGGLAIFVAFIDVYMRRVRGAMSDFFRNRIGLGWRRHVIGALLTGVIGLTAAWISGESLDLVLGTGEQVVAAAMAGQLTLQVAVIALIGKLLATMSTITSGGSAGMLVPSIYLGCMAGVIVANLGGYPAAMLIVPSITASLVSLINVPLAALMLTVEAFGAAYLLPSLVVLLVTLLLSHPNSVYRTQREQDESREILPGYIVRRINVPPAWHGKTLRDLDLRARYEVNVIGSVEKRAQGLQVIPNVPVIRPLRAGDRLVVIGEAAHVGALLAGLNRIVDTPQEPPLT